MGDASLRLLICLCLVVVCGSTRSRAQTPAPASPPLRYPLPAYEENWQYLRGDDRQDDVWDRVKFIPLSESRNAYVSLGGEARLTYERFGNQDFGLTAPDDNGYTLQRYLLRADVHLSTRVRVWTEFNSSLEDGRTGGPRPVLDRNDFDLHQLFVEVRTKDSAASSALVRVGRQEFAIGSGRLYSLREGPNVPSSFDGVRVRAQRGRGAIDGWIARPVINRNGSFDDRSLPSYAVWGLYGVAPLGSARRRLVDLYYLGLERDRARFDQGIADECRHTLGTRLAQTGAVSADVEGMFQFGRFGDGDIRAWRVASSAARVFARSAWRPRLALDLDIASGDSDPSDPDLQTFNALFQSGLYSGRAQLLGPNNSVRVEPSLALSPRRDVSVSAGWGFYWRQSIHDGLYGIAGQLIVPGNGVPGHYEGSRPIAQVDWQATRHFSAHVACIYVFNASFERASVHGTASMSYISPWVAYRL